jgi:hypothetical protein
MTQRAFTAIPDVSTYLANQTFPLGGKNSLNLIAKMESASGEKLDGLRGELSELTGEKLSILAYELLGQKQSSVVLTLIVEAIGSHHGMSQYERADIFKHIFKQYDNETIDSNKFNYLIDRFFSNMPPTPELTFSVIWEAYSTTSQELREKIKTLHAGVIDEVMHGSISRLSAGFDYGKIISKATNVLSVINLPKTLRLLCDKYTARGEEPLKIYLLSEMFSRNALSMGYLEAFKSSLDIDVICETCAIQNSKNISLFSAYNFIEEFGESALFTKKVFDDHLASMNDGILPYYFHVMSYEGYDPDRLTVLSDFVLNNAGTVYEVFTEDTSIEVKYGLLKIASAKHRVSDVLPFEIAHLRKMGRLPEGNFTFQQTLLELEANKTPHYWDAIRDIDAIGLIQSEPFLKGISRKVLKDILETVDLPKLDRKELFKIYPLSKGVLLEDELGL